MQRWNSDDLEIGSRILCGTPKEARNTADILAEEGVYTKIVKTEDGVALEVVAIEAML